MQPFGGSYIVNIMYAALLLIVLLERAVTVEFPGDAQKKKRKRWKGYFI